MRLAGVTCVALLLNSAWLWAFADPSLWYYANVAVHPLLGIVAAWIVALRVRRWRLTSPAGVAAMMLLATGLVTGFLVLIAGATRPHYTAVLAHLVTSAAG